MSAETIETVQVAGDNLTASLLVWRRFKRPMSGVVERLYEINPGLAALGPVIPVGTIVKLPIPAPKKEPVAKTVRLWS